MNEVERPLDFWGRFWGKSAYLADPHANEVAEFYRDDLMVQHAFANGKPLASVIGRANPSVAQSYS